MEISISHVLTFLVGIAAGAGGQYFADRFTDQRRRQEGERGNRSNFRLVATKVPGLIAEMRKDLECDPTGTTREFFVIPSRGIALGSSKPRFSYFESEHVGLRGAIDMLVAHKMLTDVTIGRAPIFRMSEEFAQMVMKT